ncbi:hypothetical protein, partial [Bradyrhizobium diazoefficiens]|uniref:hypothetical protein n=3 Tax=Nitrobacteraceae TaxID=41294 RepID=UPI002543956F
MVEQQKLQRLRQLITEGLRVQLGGERISYINVGHALEDASAKQNHTIFARRGCGKTLLLHASAAALGNDVRAIYLNCEDFKRHSFPNVLIVILHTLFSDLEANLTGWFGRKAQTRRLLAEITKKLKAMQHQPDEVEEAVKQTSGAEQGSGASLEAAVHAAKVGVNASRKEKSEVERAFKHHREKLRDLDHWLPELKKNLRTFFELSTNVRTILLQIDDLYHLKRADQAFVVDYIHRLCKDLPIFFKIATMRHASTLFADREGQPIGAQERHDFQPVNIDYTFSDFNRTSSLNWQILREYGRQADLARSIHESTVV